LLTLSGLLHATPSSGIPTVPSNTRDLQGVSYFPDFASERCKAHPALICNLRPTDGYDVKGRIYFEPTFIDTGKHYRCAVRITAMVRNLPNRKHGFHIHTYGDLSSSDGTSTGGHFANPAGDKLEHGFSRNSWRHWGDLDNLIAGKGGVARYDRTDDLIQLGGIVGRGVTVHEREDLGPAEQPTGGAGGRIAFCTIGYANPEFLPRHLRD